MPGENIRNAQDRPHLQQLFGFQPANRAREVRQGALNNRQVVVAQPGPQRAAPGLLARAWAAITRFLGIGNARGVQARAVEVGQPQARANRPAQGEAPLPVEAQPRAQADTAPLPVETQPRAQAAAASDVPANRPAMSREAIRDRVSLFIASGYPLAQLNTQLRTSAPEQRQLGREDFIHHIADTFKLPVMAHVLNELEKHVGSMPRSSREDRLVIDNFVLGSGQYNNQSVTDFICASAADFFRQQAEPLSQAPLANGGRVESEPDRKAPEPARQGYSDRKVKTRMAPMAVGLNRMLKADPQGRNQLAGNAWTQAKKAVEQSGMIRHERIDEANEAEESDSPQKKGEI